MEIYKEDYPCSFCGWTDGEHANGCPYDHYDYPQDVKPRQKEEPDQLICPECDSNNIGQSVVNSEHRHECQNCRHTWQSKGCMHKRNLNMEGQITGSIKIIR